MSVVEVRVHNMDCDGCAAKVRKALFKLKGVEEVDVDMDMQKVTVHGYRLDQKKVVKAIKGTGKSSEPWPFPAYSHYSSFYKLPSQITTHFYCEQSNGRNASDAHTFFHTPTAYSAATVSDEIAASMFSDENPHACIIM